MLIPYWTLLIPYILGILLFVIWMAFNVYHLIKFGYFDFLGKINLFVFIALSIAIIGISVAMLSGFPWTTTFDLLNIPIIIPELPNTGNNVIL